VICSIICCITTANAIRGKEKKMKILNAVLTTVLAFGLPAAFAIAAGESGKGKALFNDPKLGANGQTCNSCHPDGKGLEKSGARGKKEWKNPSGKWLSLEDTNNVCIMMAMKGNAIDPKGEEMRSLVAYIKSLGKKQK
jgi:mono/diheme cytochrome c family protein